MWKLATTAFTLDRMRSQIATLPEAPELFDLGLRIASAKATALENQPTIGIWTDKPAIIYVTDAEADLIHKLTDEGRLSILPADMTWSRRAIRLKFL